MSIYNVLSCEIPMISYSITRQGRGAVKVEEFSNRLLEIRESLNEESRLIKKSMENLIAETSEKAVQTTRGNLSEFLTTPIKTDADEIQRILKEYFIHMCDLLSMKTEYGLSGGYESRYLMDSQQTDLGKSRTAKSRTYLKKAGFKFGSKSSDIYESLYFIHGSINIDVLEKMLNKSNSVYTENSQLKRNTEAGPFSCAVYNLIFLDGTLELAMDKYEIHIDFAKGKVPYGIFIRELCESMKFFRKEVHDLNVTVWQRKLGLGVGEEYSLRIRTKDRSTLRAVITSFKRFLNEKNPASDAISDGIWFIKELI